ncbi:Crp/Fnr family transcriptional regulator [Deinococcus sp. KNUC1210]|uniref:Crp/Fnr family transcriptional regulator n=1 Tax=Deinococcus sp. KNUC1210 TaxID=2917691 RepID=UPI001EF09138|nr:Crp/Fnr family transcriptional regulator [Deinococcus sp. KNUC1210]ULH16372.1 Crp/Fnr family transcriptional regulator [Deinococcus sp. KNUC1210]
MSSERAAHLLRLSALFQAAPAADVQALAELAQRRMLHRGDVLFSQGDPAESLYVVESGWLKVSKLAARGQRELVLHLSGPRQVVAGVGVFVEGASYSASAAALEAVSVLTLSAEAVRHRTVHSPGLAQAVIAHFAKRHADLLERLDELLFSDLNARLARLLLEHTPPGATLLLPTNSELAARLNTVPELVSRKLGEFYRQGFISLERRRVRITDEAALRSLTGP